jgi:glycosyltransferase involved in cell wall biosynthesis
MKVLHVSARYYPHIGGLETHVQSVCERLADRFDVSVYTADRSNNLPENETINRVKVHRFKGWAPNDAYYISEGLRKNLKKDAKDYEVIHAHAYHSFPSLYAAQAVADGVLVFTPHYHGGGHTPFRDILHIPYRSFGKQVFAKADKIVCVSQYERDLVLQKFKIDEYKITVIPNGINKKEFAGVEKKQKSFRVILCVGRLEEYKGVQFLIRAMQKLGNDYLLDIVGDGVYRSALVGLAEKLNVMARVRFYQNLSREALVRKYAESDVFALLSRHEAFAITVAEALAAKTPCILANTSALTEWIDNVNCFGIDLPIEIEELSSLIHQTAGRKVEDVRLWDWEEVAVELANLYDVLCTERSG